MGMGYQGYAKFYNGQGANDTVTVLTTGASVNLVLEPIYSQSVWGAGWYNAANAAHYADNAIRYEGSIETELQVGNAGAYWNLIQDFAIAHRAYPKSLEISPDGSHVYKYLIKKQSQGDSGSSIGINDPETYTRDSHDYTHGAYCTSINFQTSEGSFVTSSVGVIAIYRSEEDAGGRSGEASNYDDFSYIKQARGVIAGNTNNVKTLAPLNPGATNINPIPYWRTNAKLFTTRGLSGRSSTPGPQNVKELFGIDDDAKDWIPQAGLETVEWNIDVSNNQQILYTCSGTRLPRAILMGAMDVTGAVTLYHDSGVFDPVTGPEERWPGSTSSKTPYDINTPFMTAEDTWFNVEITVDNGKKVFITVPAAVVESDDYSIQSADSITNRAFNIKGLGGRCVSSDDLGSFVLPPCVMSKYTNVAIANADDADLIAVPWSYSSPSSYTYNPAGYEPAVSA